MEVYGLMNYGLMNYVHFPFSVSMNIIKKRGEEVGVHGNVQLCSSFRSLAANK